MKENRPIVSVIIPTHNRSVALQRTLAALCAQTYPLQQVEILIVADGCTDNTLELLRHYQAPCALRVIEQPGQGQATARNQGAAQAMGRLLLFLDDDVEPTPTLIEAHVRAHQGRSNQVVIGPYPPVLQDNSFLQIELRAWWNALFCTMLRPGHRYSYDNFLSGNFSLEAELFTRIGGFDPAFRVHEDYELGMRFIKAGVSFTIAAEALGYHHDKSDLHRSCLRKRQEGHADALLARRHPELLPVLPLARLEKPSLFLSRILRTLAFSWAVLGNLCAASLLPALNLLEWVRLRDHWRQLQRILLDYWYWRGVAEEVGTWQELANFVQGGQTRLGGSGLKIELDLSEGLEVAEQRLDEERPAAARIHYGGHPIGLIPARPGAEPLHGAHLRPMLLTTLAIPWLEAMALEGAITISPTIDWSRLAQSIGSLTPWFGAMDPGKIWFEAYSQWQRLERDGIEAERKLREHWDLFRKLAYETAWLEDERADWQRLAEEREHTLKGQSDRVPIATSS